MSDNNDDIRITKELREWAKKPIPVLYGSSVSVFSVVTPIADRIEAEVAQLRQQLIEFMQTNAEWAKKYEDYIELPRDANGKVIRLGDELVDKTTKQPYKVEELLIDCNGDMFLFSDEGIEFPNRYVHAEDYKEPDTKLLDCPFCGGKAKLTTCDAPGYHSGGVGSSAEDGRDQEAAGSDCLLPS